MTSANLRQKHCGCFVISQYASHRVKGNSGTAAGTGDNICGHEHFSNCHSDSYSHDRIPHHILDDHSCRYYHPGSGWATWSNACSPRCTDAVRVHDYGCRWQLRNRYCHLHAHLSPDDTIYSTASGTILQYSDWLGKIGTNTGALNQPGASQAANPASRASANISLLSGALLAIVLAGVLT
jgi:hypothetical protein